MPKASGNQVPAAERRFAAFISYSHANAESAALLQRRLERYRLPPQVAAEKGERNRAIGRIFRDREDLAAAPSLTDAIKEALAASDALIVICSPAAKASRWVAEEIALFRQINPGRPVLAALVDGEPADALPEALTDGGLEPLAADLRKAGDGWSLGFLKIVAGIAGVQLDSLVQRDAQRRVRRVTWITLAAVSAMLVMAVMTSFAIQARNEAARQRASAEGLVEYMLTDLRTKLKGVNRLDVMEGVNERAMAHYRQQGDLASLPADSLEQRARILLAMGEDDQSRNKNDIALAKFEEAHRATAALLAREPSNSQRIFAHAQSEYWVGYAAFRANQPDKTLRHFLEYKRLADRLVALEPEKAEWHREVGYANGNLCTQYLTAPLDADAAVRFCKLALGNVRRFIAARPQDPSGRIDLANRHAWLSDALFEAGAIDEAWSHRQQQLALLDAAVKADPRNADYRLHWAQFYIAVAKFPQTRSNVEASREAYRKARSYLDALLAGDPENEVIRSYRSKLDNAYRFLT